MKIIVKKPIKLNLHLTITGLILIACVNPTWTIKCYVGEGDSNPQYPTDCKKEEIACRVN
jgi:hypothetical protein